MGFFHFLIPQWSRSAQHRQAPLFAPARARYMFETFEHTCLEAAPNTLSNENRVCGELPSRKRTARPAPQTSAQTAVPASFALNGRTRAMMRTAAGASTVSSVGTSPAAVAACAQDIFGDYTVCAAKNANIYMRWSARAEYAGLFRKFSSLPRDGLSRRVGAKTHEERKVKYGQHQTRGARTRSCHRNRNRNRGCNRNRPRSACNRPSLAQKRHISRRPAGSRHERWNWLTCRYLVPRPSALKLFLIRLYYVGTKNIVFNTHMTA